jgi:hypothetical protein
LAHADGTLGATVIPHVPSDLVPLSEPPTFSVVVPVYQAAHLVGEAIESLLGQTVTPYEIIVCDDGSTDDVAGALAPYADRITLLRQDHKGVAAARNLGLRHASGEFVAVADADDRHLPRLIEAFGDLATARPDLDILSRASYWERDGKFVRISHTAKEPNFPVDDQRTGILQRNFLTGHAAVRRRRLIEIGGYDESLRCASDYDVLLRLIFSGSRAGLLLEPLAVYRLRRGSLSTNEVWNRQGCIMALTKLLDGSGLSRGERAVAEERRADQRRGLTCALAIAEAKAALKDDRPDARRRSLGVLVGRGHRTRTRLKATVAVVAPRWAGRRMST